MAEDGLGLDEMEDIVRLGRLVTMLLSVVLISATGVVPATARQYRSTPQPQRPVIVTEARDERAPAADGVYFAWTANSLRHRYQYNVFFSQDGGPKHRVNPRGTRAATGGVEGTELVYSQWSARQGSDLVLYDMATDTLLPLPVGVNTDRREQYPSISGDHLLFSRSLSRPRKLITRIVLFNTVSETETVVAESDRPYTDMYPGQVNGNWVVYSRCGGNCQVFRYDILNDETTKVPNPGDLQQYAPSVSDDGLVFFSRSPSECGRNVRFMSWTGTTDPVLFLHLPKRRDSFDTFFDDSAGSLYYERVNCRTYDWDIHSAPVA